MLKTLLKTIVMEGVSEISGLPFTYDIEPKTKTGLDKLELMVRFMSVLEGKGKAEFNRFKSWLVQQLKRGITPQEDIALAEGIVKYLQSEPATPERIKAMEYLFEAKFLG